MPVRGHDPRWVAAPQQKKKKKKKPKYYRGLVMYCKTNVSDLQSLIRKIVGNEEIINQLYCLVFEFLLN